MRLPTAALPVLMLFATATTANAATGQAPASPRVPLKGADCLSPSSVRSWHYVDSRELLVDAGRRKYRITLAESCNELGGAASIVFRGDSVSGRVCGHFGERVVTTRRACGIDRVELIDDDAYRKATGTAQAGVSAGARVR